MSQGQPQASPQVGSAWPPRAWCSPTLKYDSKIFETKFAQEAKNTYDGSKGGEAWKVLIRGYLLGRVPMMKYVLKWAEDHGSNPVTAQGIAGLVDYLDEEPMVLIHLLWAFLNVNLTGAAREIFCNVEDSQGLEVWRRVHRHIYSRSERRQDELCLWFDRVDTKSNPVDGLSRGKLEGDWDIVPLKFPGAELDCELRRARRLSPS